MKSGAYKQWNISHKKNKIMLFTAAWMDIEIVILSEVIQTKINIIHYHLDVNF